MRILLVCPPCNRLKKLKPGEFPLGLGYIATFIEEEGHYIRIYNTDCGKEVKDFKRIKSFNKLARARVKAFNDYLQSINDDNHYVWKEVRNVIKKFNPDLVGITILTEVYPSGLHVARICKEINPKIKIVVGGSHATLLYHQVIEEKNIDFVVRGEGEKTIIELINALNSDGNFDIKGLSYKKNGKIIHNPDREFIEDLDKIPFPAWHLLLFPNFSEPPRGIMASRGCPYHCTFCASPRIWREKYRVRSIDNITSEIEELVRKFGTLGERYFFRFWDDTFTGFRKNINDLCNALIKKGLNSRIKWNCLTRVNAIDDKLLILLKKAGCTQIAIGIESGSNRILKLSKKGITVEMVRKSAQLIKKHGFILHTYWMLGMPDETEKEIISSIQFLREIQPDTALVNVLVPFPGTDEHKKLVSRGRLDENYDWKNPFNPYKGFTNIPQERFDFLYNIFLVAAEDLHKSIRGIIRRLWRNFKSLIKNPRRIARIRAIIQMKIADLS